MKHDTFSWNIILSYTSEYLGLETDWNSDRNWLKVWCSTMLTILVTVCCVNKLTSQKFSSYWG